MSQQGMSDRGICPNCGDLRFSGESLCRKCARPSKGDGMVLVVARALNEAPVCARMKEFGHGVGSCGGLSYGCPKCEEMAAEHIVATALRPRNSRDHNVVDSLTREWLGYLLGIEMTLDEHESLAALRMLRNLRARMESRLAGAA